MRSMLLLTAALAALAPVVAWAQGMSSSYHTDDNGRAPTVVLGCVGTPNSIATRVAPCPPQPIVGTITPAPASSAPTGGNYAVTAAVATAIPAASRLRWSYQAQGTGWACASWVTAAITIAVSTANVATCGGAGAFLLAPGSAAVSAGAATPNTALTVIGAPQTSGVLAMNIPWDAQ